MASISSWIQRIARIEEHEGALARALFLLHFSIIFAFTLAKAARDGLYLGELPARHLPYVYLGLAACTWIAVLGFGRLTARMSSHQAMIRLLRGSTIALLGFFFWFRHGGGVPAVVFYLWVSVWGLLLVSQFWILLNEMLHERQARRLIGLIGAGGILGGIVAGALASVLSRAAAPQWLLVVAGVANLLMAWSWCRVVDAIAGIGAKEDAALPRTRPMRSDLRLRSLVALPYVRLIVLMFLLGGMASSVIDYAFKVSVQDRFMDAASITVFLGNFYGSQNLIALLLQLFVTTFILSRLGARTASILLPIGILIGVGTAVGLMAFVPLVITRLYDATMRISISRSAWEFLVFPMPDTIRRQAKRFIETVVDRGAEASAALLILGLNAWTAGGPVQIAALALVLVVGWVIVELLVNRAYVRELSSALRRMVPSGDEHRAVGGAEAGLAAQLYPLLDDELETRVLYALRLLHKIDPTGVAERVPGLLRHPSPRVRAHVSSMMPELPGEIDYREIEPLLDDPDDDVRMHATYAYCNFKPGDPFATMDELLRSEQARVRSGALQCVASHAPPDADDQLESVVQEFLSRGEASDRAAVASAAGRRLAPTLVHQHLAPLLADDDPDVRRAAIRSAGATHNQVFIPILMAQLAVRRERTAARDALADYGDAVTGTLGDNLVDTGCPPAVRVEIPRVLRRIGTQAAADALLRGLLDADLTISYRVLKSLNRLRERGNALTLPVGRIEAQIEWSASRHVRFLLHRTTIATSPAGPARELLRRVIRERSQQAFERLFRGLALLYPPRETFLAFRGVTSKNARLHAQAVEFLETILGPEHRQIVLPLIDYPGSSTENMRTRHLSYARLRKSSLLLGVPVLTMRETLTDLVENGDPWLQSCALYTIGSLELDELVELVAAMRNSDDAAVREMSAWACARLGGNGSRSEH